ncbi:MAG: hypothetical protein KBT21_04185 [Treponema sp.]|nr:hypothetical protein [Candidatus Treponema merdequi]
MRNHIVRKSLGLFALYAVIIVGIFVIQFRSDSIIRKTIHSMRVTLIEAETTPGNPTLKNQFQVVYNGIQFSGDDSHPVEFLSGNKTQKAVLNSYESTDKAFTLNFSDGIKITFALSDDSETSPLMITGEFPDKISEVSINTKPLNGYSFTEQKAKQAILEGKNSSYSLIAPHLDTNRLVLLQNSKFARYSTYVKQTEFSIDSVSELAGATRAEWQNTLNTLSQTIISEFMRQSQSDMTFNTNLTEQTVVSYTAIMANEGRYNEALNTVPEAFVKGSKRTYQSSPFFGSLANTAPGLQIQMENFKNMISQALITKSCELFTQDNISDYFLINEHDASVMAVLSMPSELTDNNFTVAQAAGILHAYVTLKNAGSEAAEKLSPVLEPCVKKIADSCKLDSNKIRLSENDINLSVISAVTAGDAFVLYGIASESASIEKCGYLILNSYLSDLAGIDLRTMCEIYPVIVHNNTYYPHFAKVRMLEGIPVWTWTIARDLKITMDENRTLYVDIDFPLGLTHYVVICGINPFRRIQIYNMDFRTDPQFEIYNSSGYVYKTNMKGLLLKSRHKSQHEIIKLYYRDLEAVPETAEKTE